MNPKLVHVGAAKTFEGAAKGKITCDFKVDVDVHLRCKIKSRPME